jgi:NAD(P)-dependent dehydrogenase (short-subunit alcohol dehydrogenase family)
MRGKTVLITGANSGIGFVTARELARMGARVLTSDAEVAARLWRIGAELVGLPVDTSPAGGFPLGFAAILVFCLFSSARLLAALSSIATVAGVILAVRLYGALQDATFSQSAHLLIPETAILVISLLGAVMETMRRNHHAS